MTEELVTCTIDGLEVSVPKGTKVIRAAETLGIAIPRFCDHPLLSPVAACRQCMVEVPDGGNGRPMKPQPSCALDVAPGMVVETQLTNDAARKAQEGMIEFLLINHPLDCPICDKGGECPLQNQAMAHGRAASRYDGVKRRYPKPIAISPQILLDRERCILCQRCTRFSDEISGDALIDLTERGAKSQVAANPMVGYQSYFSGNLAQICPVGAITSSDYRFRARPFDLTSVTTTCENCAAGCELRVDGRRFQVMRRMAGDKPEINEEWNCDKGRFAFRSTQGADRLTHPLIRRDGKLEPASWPEAIAYTAAHLSARGTEVGVLTGGRLTLENAYAYARFARGVLGTNNIDSRVRATSGEETAFLAHSFFNHPVNYLDLEAAKRVVLVSFEPEEEAPMVFLRLRKAWRHSGLQVSALAPFASTGMNKLGSNLIPVTPGNEPAVLRQLGSTGGLDADTIILVGERAAGIPQLLSEVVAQARATGAKYAWIPRQAGAIGALAAGCLPNLLPGGRLVSDQRARVDLASAWGIPELPADAGLDTAAMLFAVVARNIKNMVVAGVDLDDLPNPELAVAALEQAEFVVSLEVRESRATALADVVFPVAALEEQSGTFINWAHQMCPVRVVNTQAHSPMPDVRVLAMLAEAMGSDLGMRNPSEAKRSFDEVGEGAPSPTELPQLTSAAPLAFSSDPGLVTLAGWRQLLDESRCLDGATALQASRPAPRLRMSAETAARFGLADGNSAKLTDGEGSWTGQVLITEDMVDGVVWMPLRSAAERGRLVAQPGEQVWLSAAGGEA